MAKYKIGLKNIFLSDIANDGGMGTSLVAVGDTVEGSAQMDTQEAQIQDFRIEESDSPVMSIKTQADGMTLTWSTHNNSAEVLQKFFGGTIIGLGGILTTTGLTGGGSYTNGTYTDVPLTGGTGTGAEGTIVVSGDAVTSVTITNTGKGYEIGDTLSASASDIGGTGSGFDFDVATVSSVERWEAPDAIPEIEKSIKAEWKTGGFIEIPRAKINARLTMGLKRTALSQIDITASILQPTKVGESRLKITDAE